MGDKKPNTSGNKKFLFGILIGCITMAVLFFGVFLVTRNNEEIVTFNDYLENGNFNAAHREYESANKQFFNPLNDYLLSIVNDYNSSVITYKDALSVFDKLQSSGFEIQEVEESLVQIDLLYASKESFSTANTLFNGGNQSDSREHYDAVIESDTNYTSAQEKINEIDAMVQSRIDNYNLADELYASNEIAEALNQYQLIVETGVDTEHALSKIAKIEDATRAWEAEFAEDNYDKCSYPLGTYAKGDYIYLPYSYNNTHSIVKYNIADATTEVFPLAEMVGTLVISNINVIDNYLYFIAGENVVSGRTYDNPYCIYRMKTDGTDLERVALGDYKDLIAYKDGFYASSYSKGLLKLDSNLKHVETITEVLPDRVQLVEDKLYYTVPEYTRYDMINTQYVYDGKESTMIKQDTLLTFGFYGDVELYTHKAYEYYEKLFFSNEAEEKFFMLKFDDIKMMYGLIGPNILYSMETRTGRDNYFVYSRAEHKEKEYTYKVPDYVTSLDSIYFDKELIVFTTEDGFAIADSNFIFTTRINLDELQIDTIDTVTDLSFENHPTFTDEEVVVVEEENEYWHYSNSAYHISIETKYIVDVDTNVYIAHIRTTDEEGIYIDSPADDTHYTLLRKNPLNLARQFNAVLACNGDFFDEPGNDWTGISIRDGIVYKKIIKQDMMAIYPGGDLVCYTTEDNIRYENLLYDGVRDTISFGPILLDKGEYGNDIYTNFLAGANPRCALGMIEPGHYVIILADGRQPKSAGITLKRFTDLFLDEGCVSAYNLDGGQSAAMIFMGEYVNTHKNDYTGKGFRAIGEIVYFGTSQLVPDELP